jgi:hypothetical protein
MIVDWNKAHNLGEFAMIFDSNTGPPSKKNWSKLMEQAFDRGLRPKYKLFSVEYILKTWLKIYDNPSCTRYHNVFYVWLALAAGIEDDEKLFELFSEKNASEWMCGADCRGAIARMVGTYIINLEPMFISLIRNKKTPKIMSIVSVVQNPETNAQNIRRHLKKRSK